MPHPMTHGHPSSNRDDDTAVEPKSGNVERVVTTTSPAPLPEEVVPPHPGPGTPSAVERDEFVYIAADGTVVRQAERVEREPVRRSPSSLVPALLVVLAVALALIAAAWYLAQPDNTSVPSVVGLPLNDAVTRVQGDGFKADIVSQPNEEAEGTVFDQSPSAGREAEEGSQVRLLVSNGPAEVAIPNAVGISETQARDRLAGAGLQAKVFEVFSETGPVGVVVAQSPAAGTQAAAGSPVRLNVSKGSALVAVPPVVGLTQTDAITRLEAAGLGVNAVTVPSQEPAGVVVAQNPSGGEVRAGSSVRLNVSGGS